MSKELKSAYELAMERLRAQDKAEGIDRKPLTDRQKKRIAELRQEAKAKRAEIEILHGKRLSEAGGDPERLQEAEENHRTDLRRVDSWLDSKIAEVKKGD